MPINVSKIMEVKGREWRVATLNVPVRGKFSRFKPGETVRVTHVAGSSYMIERVKWNGHLTILNQCCGIPRSALTFHIEEPPRRRHGKI